MQFGVCPNSGSMGLVCRFAQTGKRLLGEKNKCEARPYLCTRIRMDVRMHSYEHTHGRTFIRTYKLQTDKLLRGGLS